MTNTVIANGHTYTDDDDDDTGMGNGGYEIRLIPMLSDVMHDVGADMAAAGASATAAAISAASAINGLSTSASSTTALATSLGTKTLVVQPGKNFVQGMFLTLARTSAPTTTWMNGPVTSYNPSTGALVMEATRVLGTATGVTDWTVSLSAPASPATGGSAVSGTAAVVLTPSSLKYQEAQPAGYGANYQLTAPSNSIQGPGAFTLFNRPKNGYAFDLRVALSPSTNTVGYLRPGQSAAVDVIGSSYSPRGLSAYGFPVVAQVTFSGIVAGTAGVWTKAVPLPSGATMVLVHGANLHAVLYDGAGAFSSSLLVRSGLSTAGADGTVAAIAVNDGTDNVLVASVPDGGTALQTLVITVGGTTLGLATMVATTVSATGRIVGLHAVPDSGSAGGPLFILGLMNSAGTSLMTYGIGITTAGAGNIAVGGLRAEVTVGGIAAILTDTGSPNVYMTVTVATATTMSAKAISLSAALAQALGTVVVTTITSGSAISVRAQFPSANPALEQGYWALGYIVSNTAKLAKLTLSGTVPTVSAGTTVNSAITTVTSLALGGELFGWEVMSTAVCGTDASGRFLVEMVTCTLVGAAPTPFGGMAIIPVSMSAAAAAVWIGVSSSGGNNNGSGQYWQLTSAAEMVIGNTIPDATIPNVYRMQNAASYAHVLQAPDPLTIKSPRHRNTLRSTTRVLALGDGSKPSMEYNLESGHVEPTLRPVPLANNSTFGSFGGEAYRNSTWVAAGPAPAVNLLIQNFVLT